MGSAPSELSIVSCTSARPSGGRPDVPAKMTSSILPPRRDLAPCSPSTQAIASTTLDLPEPLGPTTAVMPGSKRNVVAEAKDLKPLRVRLFRCTRGSRLCFAPERGQGHGVQGGGGRPGQTLPAAAADPGRPARDRPHPHPATIMHRGSEPPLHDRGWRRAGPSP